jgi:hypothetical protein
MVIFALLSVLSFFLARYTVKSTFSLAPVLVFIGFFIVLAFTSKFAIHPAELQYGIWPIIGASILGTWWDTIWSYVKKLLT